MNKIETKPRENDLYEIDFYVWTQEQARLLRERRWTDLDLNNLVDEVASVGKSEKREIESRTRSSNRPSLEVEISTGWARQQLAQYNIRATSSVGADCERQPQLG